MSSQDDAQATNGHGPAEARRRLQAGLDRGELLQALADAETDQLTGARARAAGLADLEHEIERARSTRRLLTLAYVDVVGLKAVNDTHGHGAGDALLARTAAAIRSHLRTYDLIVRHGGDEFLCVLSGATLRQARKRFSAIQTDLAADPEPCAIKIGFAELQPHETVTELIERADAQLPISRGRSHGDSSEPDGLSMGNEPHDRSGPSSPGGARNVMDPHPVASTARQRVLIADDDPVVQAALRVSLAVDFEVVGVAGDSRQATDLAAVSQPDAAIVDVDMPGGGLAAVRGILKASPATAIVVLSSDELSGVVRELLLAGATAYCRKGVSPQVLAEWLKRSVQARAVERAAQTPVHA
jgi:diguanylate cyclase (GGDEF)-like protein